MIAYLILFSIKLKWNSVPWGEHQFAFTLISSATDVGKMTLGFRAKGQERILETSLVQNNGLLKHGDRTSGQKDMLHLGCEGDLYTIALGRQRKREVSKELSYAKEDLGDTQGLALVKLSLFFPSSKALTLRYLVDSWKNVTGVPSRRGGWGRLQSVSLCFVLNLPSAPSPQSGFRS